MPYRTRMWTAGAAVTALFFVPLTARAELAEGEPLLEIGVLGAVGSLPDYPAAGQNHYHYFAVPYLLYRGEYFQVSANSIRGIFLKTERVSLDVSASGSLSSHDNEARRGMPGLDDMGQIGPRLNVLLARDVMKGKIDFELPLRAVFSTDYKSLDYRGLVLAPELAYSNANFMDSGGALKLWIGPEFATARLMDYYYEVQPQYAMPGRSQFTASGGYLGSHINVTYRHPIGRYATITTYVGPELYTGASNEASPLFKKQFGVSAGMALSFSFYESSARAHADTGGECCAP